MHLSLVRTHRLAMAVLLTVICAVVVSACGSSSASSSSSSSASAASGGGANSGSAQFAKYQSCLKSHGVTLPAFHRRSSGTATSGSSTTPSGGSGGPPAGGGGGFFGGGGANTAQSAKFKAASQACAKDLPKGAHAGRFGQGRAGGHFDAATLQKFSACVKQHGYTLPKPNTSGSGPVFPRSIEKNATFEKAAKACQSDLRPSGGSAPGSPPAS